MSYTRRNFLSAVLAGSAATVCLPRVGGAAESPDHAVLGRSPMYRIPEILRDKTGLKIRSVETLTKDANVSVVRVRTDDGSEGFGQLSTFDADLTAQIMHRKVAPLALGQDPADLDTLVDRCIEANYKFPWSYVCRRCRDSTPPSGICWESEPANRSVNCSAANPARSPCTGRA